MELVAIVAILSGIGSLICLIIVLTKLFPQEGVLKGIFGIICGLYTFIWGWSHKDECDLQTVMPIWTLLFIINIILSIILR